MLSRLLFGGLIGLVLSLGPVQAQSRVDQLYDIGLDACSYALKGYIDTVDGAFFAAAISEARMSEAEYCRCVATEFTDGDDDDLALLNADSLDSVDHRAFMTAMNMMICLPDASDVVDGDLADIDLEEEELPDEDFAYDESDVYMCQQALDGGIMVPGFNEAEVLERMDAGGQTRTQLCTCAARYFAAGGEGLQEDIENAGNPTIAYTSTMAGAIEVCL